MRVSAPRLEQPNKASFASASRTILVVAQGSAPRRAFLGDACGAVRLGLSGATPTLTVYP